MSDAHRNAFVAALVEFGATPGETADDNQVMAAFRACRAAGDGDWADDLLRGAGSLCMWRYVAQGDGAKVLDMLLQLEADAARMGIA